MANGTAGLGQGSQVFDFSNLGQQGLAYDARNLAKKEVFQKDNAALYSGIDNSGIRDVDSPFINAEIEAAMEASATAQKTMNPADAQKAKLMMQTASKHAATSVAAQTAEYKTQEVLRQTPEYARNMELYNSDLNTHRTQTAMNSGNGGEVGQGIIYQSPVIYDSEKSVAEFAQVDSEKVLRASLEKMGTSVTNADGTSRSYSIAEVDPEIKSEVINSMYMSQMESNKEFRLSVEAQYMAKIFGKEDLLDRDVAQFNAMRAEGEDIRSKFASLDAIKEAPEYANNPFKRDRALKAFNIENELAEYGRQVYTEAVDPRATKGKSVQSAKSDAAKATAGDGLSSDDLATSNGININDVLGNVKISGSFPNRQGQKLGYSSAPKLKSFGSGSGTERIAFGGVVAQRVGKEVQYFAVEYKPSEDIMARIADMEAAGSSEEAISALLQKTDATLVNLPSGGGYSRATQGDLKTMKREALKQAGFVNLDQDTQEEEAPVTEGVGGKYN